MTRLARLSNEERTFVGRTLRVFVEGDPPGPTDPGPPDWDRIDRLLAFYNLTPVFYHALAPEVVPAERRGRWQRLTTAADLRNRHFVHSAARVFECLRTAGIRAVALRGMALIHGLYPHPSMRPMTDVDILVAAADRQRVIEALARDGRQPEKILRSQLVYLVDGTPLEIHWSFLTPKRYRGIADFGPWLQDGIRSQGLAGEIRCLRWENELIGLVCHAFMHHQFDNLFQLVDIAMLTARCELDWDYIRRWTQAASISRLMSFTFDLIAALMGSGQPPGWMSAVARAPVDNGRMTEVYADFLFGAETRRGYLQRRKSLLSIPEHFDTRWRQMLQFFSWRELSTLTRILWKGRLVRHG